MTLLFAFLIGLFAGLRSLTPPAAVAWAVYLGWLKLARPLALVGSLPAVIILSLLAITEVIFEKLPLLCSKTWLRAVESVHRFAILVRLGNGSSAHSKRHLLLRNEKLFVYTV